MLRLEPDRPARHRPIPGAKHCFAVLDYGGNGITFSAIAAQMIQRAILDLPDPDSDLFALPD